MKEISIINRKARFEYHVLEVYKAGIVLTGTEIKSLRLGNANISEAFCLFVDGELFIRNMFISEFKNGTYNNHVPIRDRKLLLTKKELKKLESAASDRGHTIIPLKVYSSETGYAKIEIALATGKKTYDKREDIKQREVERQIKRIMG